MQQAIQGLTKPGTTPQVFRDVYTGRETGLLNFRYLDDRCGLRFLRGNIVFADSSLNDLQLGEVLVQRHLLTAHQLAEATMLVASELRRLGDALIAKGYVSPAGLDAALTIHVQEVLAHILTWTDGSYRFEAKGASILNESDVTLTQSTGELLLGAVSGVSDPGCIRFGLDPSERVLIPTADPLSATEAEHGRRLRVVATRRHPDGGGGDQADGPSDGGRRAQPARPSVYGARRARVRSGARKPRGPDDPAHARADSHQLQMYRARFLGHQFDDLGFVWQTIPKTTHEDAPGSTRRGESIPGVAPL